MKQKDKIFIILLGVGVYSLLKYKRPLLPGVPKSTAASDPLETAKNQNFSDWGI